MDLILEAPTFERKLEKKIQWSNIRGKSQRKKNAVCCCFNNHNKYFCASSNMYVSYGIYFVLIIDSHKNKIWLDINDNDEY